MGNIMQVLFLSPSVMKERFTFRGLYQPLPPSGLCAFWVRERQSQPILRVCTAMPRIAWVRQSCIHSASAAGGSVVCKGTVPGPGNLEALGTPFLPSERLCSVGEQKDKLQTLEKIGECGGCPKV